jgi:hypothetical protein
VQSFTKILKSFFFSTEQLLPKEISVNAAPNKLDCVVIIGSIENQIHQRACNIFGHEVPVSLLDIFHSQKFVYLCFSKILDING